MAREFAAPACGRRWVTPPGGLPVARCVMGSTLAEPAHGPARATSACDLWLAARKFGYKRGP
jgi:hypothetical protein